MDLPTIVRTLAALVVVSGLVFAIEPEILKRLLRMAIKGKVPYVIAVLRICIGVLLLWVGGNNAKVVGVVGAIILLAGILGLVVKLETQRKFTNSIIDSSEITRRLLGIAAVVIGSLVLIDVWPKW